MYSKPVMDTMKHFAKIMATLRGGYKAETNWMTGQIDLEKQYWKNKCLIEPSW
jgi:hypothetical protein